VTPELADPDVIYVRPPDKYHFFDTGRPVKYIPVPPMPPSKNDPTGMQRMMEFLGFDKRHVDVAVGATRTDESSQLSNNIGNTVSPSQVSAPTGGAANPPAIVAQTQPLGRLIRKF
jgi:hypothetical protein